MTLAAKIILTLGCLGLVATYWPQPHVEYHWHQTCVYDAEGNGPLNICDRPYWDI